jgi:hypothetical protein
MLLVQTVMAGGSGTIRMVVPASAFFPNGIYNMCYGESGEMVADITGSTQIITKSSGSNTIFHVNGIGGGTGVGAISGDTYHIGGALQDVVVEAGESFVHNFQVIGPGPNNNFVLKQRFQVHMTTDGPVITSNVDEGYCR